MVLLAPVLVIAVASKPYELVCDACGYGVDAVLLQDGKTVEFFSSILNGAERNYPTGEHELMAVVEALDHWRHRLEGCVGTDIG